MFSSDSISLLGESDEYLEQGGYLDEEEMISGEDLMQGTINNKGHLLKRRRVFRAPRERQRGKRNILHQNLLLNDRLSTVVAHSLFYIVVVLQWKMLLECCFATRRSCLHTSVWKTCRKPSKSMVWTATRWLPLHPLLRCYLWPQRRWQSWASLTHPRRSFWTMPGAATLSWMRRHLAGCRPWRRITCSCLSPTGLDTDERKTAEWEIFLENMAVWRE